MKDKVYIKIYCAIEKSGKVMLTQDIDDGPLWKFPGGHVEKNELILTAAEREVKEETGYKIKLTNILTIEDYFHKQRQGEHNLKIFAIGKVIGGKEIIKKDEVKRLKWFSKKEIKILKEKEIYFSHLKAFKLYKKGIRYPISVFIG